MKTETHIKVSEGKDQFFIMQWGEAKAGRSEGFKIAKVFYSMNKAEAYMKGLK